MSIRIMSFNTQHCLNYKTKKIDFPLMAETIKALGGEIVGLQEIRGKGEAEDYADQAKILAELLGYNYYFAEAIRFGGKNPYGNALISRYPILSAETVLIPDPKVKKYDGYYETRCILKAVVDVGEKLNVLVGHFGLNPDEQENAVKTVFENLTNDKCVLMGDFNITPDNQHISEIGKVLFDTAKAFDVAKFSFPSDKPERKIDYIFTSNDLKVISADIPNIVASDHRPYICDIEA